METKRYKFIISLTAFSGILLLAFTIHPKYRDVQNPASAVKPSSVARYYLAPILCFHNLDGKGPYSTSRQEFRYYMEQIREAGIQVIALRKLLEHAQKNQLLQQPSIVITIDDDYTNIVRVAAPILREYRYPATIFAYIQNIHKNPQRGMSWEDLNRLHSEGFEIQNHSYSHTAFHLPLLTESSTRYEKRVEREILLSRDILEKNMPGNKIYAFAYPMGYHSTHLEKKLLGAGYDLLLTTDAHPVDLRKVFTGVFDRYTIQKKYVKNPQAMFRRQLSYAKKQSDL